MTLSETKSSPNGATDIPQDSAIAPTSDASKEGENAIAETDAPAYTSPGPDEKLSRSYIPTDAKSPIPPVSPKHVAESATTTTQPQSPGMSRQEPKTSLTSQSRCGSPTSISGTREEGAVFRNGAAVTGPNAEPDVHESVHARAVTAETNLSAKTKTKLTKAELKDGKRLSKIIKSESKAEKQALEMSIKELSQLQSQQTSALKREAKAYAAHSKALKLHHQTESNFLKLKAEYEQNQLNTQSMEAALDRERANSRDIMERTSEKAREVERLRVIYGTDERERQAKLLELNQGKPQSRFSLS